MSDCWLTAFGVSAQRAPCDTRPSALAFVRVLTWAGYPLLRRCPHMDAPMTPVPIQPTRGRDALEVVIARRYPFPGQFPTVQFDLRPAVTTRSPLRRRRARGR